MGSLYFPQINSNFILTQLPYSAEQAYNTAFEDLETGMRWAFAFRAGGLTGYPTGPLGKFAINFSNITDSEVATLEAFFNAVRGKWMSFQLLDPSGNLLKVSEDFTNAAWIKTSGVIAGQSDPFNHSNACLLTAGYVESVIGSSSGGMYGIVMCASVWVMAATPGTVAQIGFKDATTSTITSNSFALPVGSWVRVYCNCTVPTNNQFLFYLSVNNSCYAYGAQVSPTKGESTYVKTPGNYGYHANVRFDTDNFQINSAGPNSNSILLPIVEVNT